MTIAEHLCENLGNSLSTLEDIHPPAETDCHKMLRVVWHCYLRKYKDDMLLRVRTLLLVAGGIGIGIWRHRHPCLAMGMIR